MDITKRIIIALFLFLLVFMIGIFGYKFVGGPTWSYLDAAYMTVITLTTVGFREVHDIQLTQKLNFLQWC